jgi:hypothetical protein
MHLTMHMHRRRMSEVQITTVRSLGIRLALINLPCIDTMKTLENKLRRLLNVIPQLRISVFGRAYYIHDIGRILSMVRTSDRLLS